MDYRNAEAIQHVLLNPHRLAFTNNTDISTMCRPRPSRVKDIPKFNGFSFAVNLKKIGPAAYEDGVNLFDPNDRMVSQEDHLTERMTALHMVPMILPCVFLYHFKSITVSSANFTIFEEELKKEALNHNITIQRRGNTPVMYVTYPDPTTGQMIRTEVDVREDLHWYHLIQDSNNRASDIGGSSGGGSSSEEADTGHGDESGSFVKNLITNLLKGTKETTSSNGESLIKEASLQCLNPSNYIQQKHTNVELPLFPVYVPAKLSRLQRLHRDDFLHKMNWNIRYTATSPSRICLYPNRWFEHCDRLLLSKNIAPNIASLGLSSFTPELFAVDEDEYGFMNDNNLHDHQDIYVIGLAIPSTSLGMTPTDICCICLN